jgi:hypothetical protein
MPPNLQDALERLMMNDWITLIDVAAVRHVSGNRLVRLWKITDAGMARMAELKKGKLAS